MKPKHSKNYTYEKQEEKTFCLRNGMPTMIVLPCPNREDKELQNVVILKRIKNIHPLDILTALLSGN